MATEDDGWITFAAGHSPIYPMYGTDDSGDEQPEPTPPLNEPTKLDPDKLWKILTECCA